MWYRCYWRDWTISVHWWKRVGDVSTQIIFVITKILLHESSDDPWYIISFYRFNWGLRVRKLSERILKLLRNKDFFTEERARARNLSHAIKGFGSFNQRSSAIDERLSDLPSKIYGRCNSYYDNRQYEKYDFTSLGKKLSTANGNEREQQIHEDNDNSKLLLKQENDSNSKEVTE